MASAYPHHSPRTFSSDTTNTQYYQQYGQPLQAPYHTPLASSSLPSHSSGLSQGDIYSYAAGPANGYTWGQPSAPTRSMSTGESEEMTHGFSQAYRTNTYPSLERRMTGEMQHIPSTNAGYLAMSMGNSPPTIPAQLRDHSAYHPMQMEMQQEWAGGGQSAHISGQPGGAYSSSWYPQQGLAGLREEEDHSHTLASQEQHLRRRQQNSG
jgi:hypothetical protein